MAKSTGRNINTTDEAVTATVTINSVTATTILAANPNRVYARVSLDSGTGTVECFIREYAASVDNNKAGEILVRDSLPNIRYNPNYSTLADNPYTGEISAISVLGSFDLHITEG